MAGIWWTLRRQAVLALYDSAIITSRTSQPDHIFMKWGYHKPARHPLWRIFRGKSHLCGYEYVWDTPFVSEQLQSGDTWTHWMRLTDLPQQATIWFYLCAPDGMYGLEIQGPLSSFTLPYPPALPEPTPAVIYWNIANRRIRTGNHYTWWANHTWYALVPTTTSLTIWRLIAGAMTRLDVAHEPTPPAGTIQDADSRMTPDAATLHVPYFCLVTAPGPNLLRYATFDLTADAWAIDEQICTPTRKVFDMSRISLALDLDTAPHVVYPDYANTHTELHYRNKKTGVWSDAETALAFAGVLVDYPSVALDPTNQNLHLIANLSTGEQYYTMRPRVGPPWADPTPLDDSLGAAGHSVAAGVEPAHIAQVGLDWRIDHYEAVNGFDHQGDLTWSVSRYANMISSPFYDPLIAIVFRDRTDHLAYIYRPPAKDWQPDVQLDPTVTAPLAATYAHADVVSCLWRDTGPTLCALFAFYAPWH